MTEAEVRDTVVNTLREIAPEADLDALNPDIAFRDQFEIDSLDFVTLVLTLEKAFGITVPSLAYPQLSTLNGCVRYLTALAVAE